MFYASNSEELWPKVLGEKASVVDYVFLSVQQNDAVLLKLFKILSQTQMHKEGKKQAQSDCMSQGHLYTVFVACTPLDTVGQMLSVLGCNSIALHGIALM